MTYEHDCKDCKFVAVVALDGGLVDCYVCSRVGPLGRSVILRYGSRPPQYWSSPINQIRKINANSKELSSWNLVAEYLYERSERDDNRRTSGLPGADLAG